MSKDLQPFCFVRIKKPTAYVARNPQAGTTHRPLHMAAHINPYLAPHMTPRRLNAETKTRHRPEGLMPRNAS